MDNGLIGDLQNLFEAEDGKDKFPESPEQEMDQEVEEQSESDDLPQEQPLNDEDAGGEESVVIVMTLKGNWDSIQNIKSILQKTLDDEGIAWDNIYIGQAEQAGPNTDNTGVSSELTDTGYDEQDKDFVNADKVKEMLPDEGDE